MRTNIVSTLAFVSMLASIAPGHADDAAPTFIATHSGCKVFDAYPQAGESVTWSGKCVDGYASGPGIVKWVVAGKVTETDSATMVRGMTQGKGKMWNTNFGLRYAGDYKDGMKEGRGTYYYDDGHYEGEWSQDERSGEGTVYDKEGGVRYRGQWSHDRWNGAGTVYLKSADLNGTAIPGDSIVATWHDFNPEEGALLMSATGAIKGTLHGGSFVSDTATSHVAAAPVETSSNDDEDEPAPSTGMQVLSGLLQGVARGSQNLASQRAVMSASHARAAQATAVSSQLAAASMAGAATPAAAAPSHVSHSQDATGCIRLDGGQIQNACAQVISVVWCVQGDYSNCNRGYDNESDIPAGRSIAALPLKHPGSAIQVYYAACSGSNTATAHGMTASCD